MDTNETQKTKNSLNASVNTPEDIRERAHNALHTARVGVWGFGVVGKSVVRFLTQRHQSPAYITVFDKRALTDGEKKEIARLGATIVTDETSFLEESEVIIPSPGVNIDGIYTQYAHKWLCELDFFAILFESPIIAITGSFGKTSITSLLSQCLDAQNITHVMGGNIGVACLDLLDKKLVGPPAVRGEARHASDPRTSAGGTTHPAVLEVSSYQLAYSHLFSPDLAIITNIVPNHLDWHPSEDAYVRAKLSMIFRQTSTQQSLVPLGLKARIAYLAAQDHITIHSQQHFFSNTVPTSEELQGLTPKETLFYRDGNTIVRYANGEHTPIISLNAIPKITFDLNWVIICSALTLMNISLKTLAFGSHAFTIPEHRLELCTQERGITIYNDSKSTIPDVTLAAVAQLQARPILLIIGGLGKGIDRTPFVAALRDKVKRVYTFGAETTLLSQLCHQFAIPVTSCISLEQVVSAIMHDAISGDQILFSPAGSSYDLFKNYEQRGKRFKELIKQEQKLP